MSIGIHIITQSAPTIVCESTINKHEWHERNQFNYNAVEESKLKSCKCDCVWLLTAEFISLLQSLCEQRAAIIRSFSELSRCYRPEEKPKWATKTYHKGDFYATGLDYILCICFLGTNVMTSWCAVNSILHKSALQHVIHTFPVLVIVQMAKKEKMMLKLHKYYLVLSVMSLYHFCLRIFVVSHSY